MTAQLVRPAASAMSDGTVAGGQFHREYLNSVECLEPGLVGSKWQQMAPMKYSRQGISLVTAQVSH